MPRKIVIVPSVTTIGGIASFQTRIPLNIPSRVPKPMAMSTMKITGRPGAAMLIRDTTIPVSARLAATDRSMHFVRITII